MTVWLFLQPFESPATMSRKISAILEGQLDLQKGNDLISRAGRSVRFEKTNPMPIRSVDTPNTPENDDDRSA
jgi:hypothetical protein